MEEEKISHAAGYLVGALAGAAFGVGAGIIIGRALARREAEARITAEVAAIKAHYIAKANMAGKGDNPFKRPEAALGTGRLARPGTFTSLVQEPEPSGAAGEPDDDDHDDGDRPEEPQFPGVKEPYIISEDEFREDMVGELTYAKLTIYYYVDDDGLIDNAEIPIPNMEEIVGNDFKYHFGEDGIVFVRNERILTDFEVVRENGSFGIRLGYGDPNAGH
jgi:hypothetical protein